MALLWIFLLVVQPFLIQAKKYELHRQVGNLGYFIVSFLIISLFLVVKVTYFKNLATQSEMEALAILPNDTVEIFAFFNPLFLCNEVQKNMPDHLRFMAGTGLMMFGLGLGRFLATN